MGPQQDETAKIIIDGRHYLLCLTGESKGFLKNLFNEKTKRKITQDELIKLLQGSLHQSSLMSKMLGEIDL